MDAFEQIGGAAVMGALMGLGSNTIRAIQDVRKIPKLKPVVGSLAEDAQALQDSYKISDQAIQEKLADSLAKPENYDRNMDSINRYLGRDLKN